MTEEAAKSPPRRIRIEKLQDAHIDALLEVEAGCTAMYQSAGFGADGSDSERPPVAPRNAQDLYRLPQKHDVFVAEADGEIVGYTALRDEAPGVLIIEELSVHPAFQRFGIGTRLISKAVARANELGLGALILTTYRQAPWAAAFYRSHEFVDAGQEPPPMVAEWLSAQEPVGPARHHMFRSLID